jgi:4a-hydroxytetrahydrobiopterin dehydratase
MSTLAKERCTPCHEGEPAIDEREKSERLGKLPGWEIVRKSGVPTLERSFIFEDFKQAMDFAMRVGEEAEEQDHHPSLTVDWGRVTVRWSTHKIKDLHRNDFIMAAKTDELYAGRFAPTGRER